MMILRRVGVIQKRAGAESLAVLGHKIEQAHRLRDVCPLWRNFQIACAGWKVCREDVLIDVANFVYFERHALGPGASRHSVFNDDLIATHRRSPKDSVAPGTVSFVRTKVDIRVDR